MEFSKVTPAARWRRHFQGVLWPEQRAQGRWLQATWPEALGVWAKAAAVGGGQWVGLRGGNMWSKGSWQTSLDVQLQVCTYSLDITLECFTSQLSPLGWASVYSLR